MSVQTVKHHNVINEMKTNGSFATKQYVNDHVLNTECQFLYFFTKKMNYQNLFLSGDKHCH